MTFSIFHLITARPLDPSQLIKIQQTIKETEEGETTSFLEQLSKIFMSFINVKEFDPDRVKIKGVRTIMSNGRIHLIPVKMK